MHRLGWVIWLWVGTYALGAIGSVTAVEGTVRIERAGTTLPVELKMPLEEHDTIHTDPKSWVRIELQDHTRISLGGQGVLRLDAYRFDGTDKSQASFSFLKGVFQAVSGAIGKVARKNFHVQTPTATIGIRGTEFYVDLRQNTGHFLCTKGAIVVKSTFGLRGAARELVVPAGGQIASFTWNGYPNTQQVDSQLLQSIQSSLGLH
jgi:hypothetical protein